MATPEFSDSTAETIVRIYSSETPKAIADYGILQALADAGISILPLNTESEGQACLFCTRSITQELYQKIQEASRSVKVLVILLPGTKSSSVEHWKLLQAGAADILNWEGSPQPAEEIAARLTRWREVDTLMQSAAVQENLVGTSPTWTSILRRIVEIAHFTVTNMLFFGESGTGKELTARLVHDLDAREKKGRFVILDCTTIVPELSGSEFFGHERGAFTGASHTRDGAFAMADQGTLFLDEVGELPLALQAQLLRVVQEGSFKRIGGNTWRTTAFRLVCATNRNLEEEVKQGRFRHDLFHRIANWTFTLPPLQNRSEDILSLARHFMRPLCQNDLLPELDSTVRSYLVGRNYSGNIRELRQLSRRIMHRHVGSGRITAGDIPEEERPCVATEPLDRHNGDFDQAVRRALSFGAGLKEIGRAAEDVAEQIVLEEEDGNLQRAARKLGVTDRALQMRRAARLRREQEEQVVYQESLFQQKQVAVKIPYMSQ